MDYPETAMIIYHDPCPDGLTGAAIVAQKMDANGINWTSKGDQYRDAGAYPERPDFEIPESVNLLYIVDFSYPAEWLNYWAGAGIEVVIYEHHAAKFAMLTGTSELVRKVLNAGECGATLAYADHHPLTPREDWPEILEHVRNRDIGTGDYYEAVPTESGQRSLEVNTGLDGVRSHLRSLVKLLDDPAIGPAMMLKTYGAVLNLSSKGIEALAVRGRALLCEDQKVIDGAIANPEGRTYRGGLLGAMPLEYGVLFLTESQARLYSRIASAMLVANPRYSFALVFTDKAHLRSLKNGPNIEPLAKAMGGGGHPHASGFSIGIESISRSINLDHD